MSGKVSAETKYALDLHIAQGKTITEACRIAGIRRSTLYVALARRKEKRKK